MTEKKDLNKEELSKVTGGEGLADKWYFCYYHITREEYAGEWCGPYDSEDDYVLFASEHPIENPGEYRIEKKCLPNTGRTIRTYV